jgi:hypothetical protein
MSDEFTRGVFRLTIARIAQQKGFTAISESALEIPIGAIIDHLSEMARSAARVTTRCNRSPHKLE